MHLCHFVIAIPGLNSRPLLLLATLATYLLYFARAFVYFRLVCDVTGWQLQYFDTINSKLFDYGKVSR